jgi:hypothetical protein
MEDPEPRTADISDFFEKIQQTFVDRFVLSCYADSLFCFFGVHFLFSVVEANLKGTKVAGSPSKQHTSTIKG